jgi:hypothetical protein
LLNFSQGELPFLANHAKPRTDACHKRTLVPARNLTNDAGLKHIVLKKACDTDFITSADNLPKFLSSARHNHHLLSLASILQSCSGPVNIQHTPISMQPWLYVMAVVQNPFDDLSGLSQPRVLTRR